MRTDDPRGGTRGPTSRSVRGHIAGLLMAACAGGLSGCSDGAPKGSATLEPGAFRSNEEEVKPVPVQAPVKTTSAEEAAAGFLDLTSLPGAPSTLTTSPTTATGEAVIIDQFIGQINGHAMMASEFFGDGFGDRLRAMGKEEKYAQAPGLWVKDVAKEIQLRLYDKIRNGLLLDEAFSALPQEVRQQGLRYAMEKLKSRIVSGNEGSVALTDERMRQATGKTFDEFLNQRRDELLMSDHIENKVRARVNVSWQQIKNEWERRQQEAEKKKRVRFSLIQVKADNSEAIAAVTARLDQGTPFREIAESDLNQFKMTDGARHVETPINVELAKTRIIGIQELNTPAQGMSPGQTSGPIQVAAYESVFWIHFDELIVPTVPPLYDSQIEILEELRKGMTSQEQSKYFGRLMEKSSLTPINEMHDRLIGIAISRYAPRGKP